MDLATLRNEYMRASLDAADVHADPFRQFASWFDDAYASKVPEVNAMTLATVGDDGWPSARVVLLKGVDARGFTFYTNLRSRKGRDVGANPRAALLFFWAELERQVRIEGTIERVPDAESDAYFAKRPRLTQIGAWASPQSEPIPDRAWLEQRVQQMVITFGDGPVLRPAFWGGWLLRPTAWEFWQGRPSRLHDRLRYTPIDEEVDEAEQAWQIERLSP